MKFFLGIDPGKSGGWAVLRDDSSYFAAGLYIEDDFLDTVSLYCLGSKDSTLACIEKVHSMPGQGVKSMFTFGENFGWWQGVLEALSIPYELITPQRWMQEVLDSGDRSPEHRLAFARRRWPDAPLSRKKDVGAADALCLAEYVRRTHVGE